MLYKSNLWRITLDTNPEDCNYHCIMCEEHSPYSNYKDRLFKECGVKRRVMDRGLLSKIFCEAAGAGVKEVIPSTMGEPLLYEGIDDFYSLARKYALKVNLTTNGSFPRRSIDEWVKVIVPSTSDVKISINGANKDTSQSIMRGSDFDKQISNIKSLVAYRNEYYKNTGVYCSVTLQLTFMQNNMEQLSDIIAMAAALDIDRVKGHHLWAHFSEIKHLSIKDSDESVAQWNGCVEKALLAQKEHLRKNGKEVRLENIMPLTAGASTLGDDYECPFLGKELWISATGVISPCCAPSELRETLGCFGNIKDISLEDVIKSAQYQVLLATYKDCDLCKTCNMRRPPCKA